MVKPAYVIGVDFGTDSVRAVVVNAGTGEEMGHGVMDYPRWADGKYCDPAKNRYRQHPLDYLEGLDQTIKNAIVNCSGNVAKDIKAIAVDTTGSTPVALDKNGMPLSMTPEFSENPNAMFILWKDHTAVAEAEEINDISKNWGGEDFTKYVGGIYSSEWFWSKILHVLRKDAQVRKAAYSWVEHCDWIPAILTGNTDPLAMKRSRCAAGHKAMWHSNFDGLPSEKFLAKVDKRLSGLRHRLYTQTFTSDKPAGNLTKEWAKRLGLSEKVAVGVGAFDAHMGAVGGGIKPNMLTKVIGTSTCDMVIASAEEIGDKLIRGICGQVDGSIIPGMIGMEAGQSAFGDVYAWFKNVLLWPLQNIIGNSSPTKNDELRNQISDKIIDELSNEAAKLPIEENNILAVDWFNGRRTPDANQLLKGAITGLNLGSNPPAIFKALVESTAYGAKKIIDRFVSEGVKIKGVIALGGIPKKSPFIMQIIADVLNMPVKVCASEQACALGAAMFAATVCGIYKKVEAAQDAMSSGFDAEYKPNTHNAEIYRKLYHKYSALGDFIESFIAKKGTE